MDYAWPEPDPAPVTTIAGRLGHITVACSACGWRAEVALLRDLCRWHYDGAAGRSQPSACRTPDHQRGA
jgi:hypothetical protein